jgi:demethylmenaquinone methyltransferase/2-methoxy-6-polyprenyl-1,4-benzoquinol methylase
MSKPLHYMFTTVPPRYDLVNRVTTWGLDARWRRLAARECLSSHPFAVLDIGCGTGDLILTIAQQAEKDVELSAIDYSQPMLDIAVKKAKRLGLEKKVTFIHGDVTSLPFPDGSFDCVGISFAFRNLTYKNPHGMRHFPEVLRVLKPGGKYVIVETSQPQSKIIRSLFHLYLRWFAYPAGYLISGNKGAYRYLAESAAHFYTADEIKGMLITTGFRQVTYHPLLWGAAGIHVAVK